MSDIKLGQLPSHDSPPRDAIHVPVAQVRACGEKLKPAQPVTVSGGTAYPLTKGAVATGIVDPFLPGPVEPYATFWLLVAPKTVTDLRHEWTHPAFPIEQPSSDVSDDYQDDSCKGCYD